MTQQPISKDIYGCLQTIIENRDRFFPYLSEPGMALMGEVWKETDQSFTNENQTELDNLRAEVSSDMRRQLFSLFCEVGYFLWMAERLAEGEAITPSTATSAEQLGLKDSGIIALDAHPMKQETAEALLKYTDEVLQNSLELFPDIALAPQEFRNNLQTALIKEATATYQIACLEAAFRKNPEN